MSGPLAGCLTLVRCLALVAGGLRHQRAQRLISVRAEPSLSPLDVLRRENELLKQVRFGGLAGRGLGGLVPHCADLAHPGD
jgi:hypothetical protein